MFELVFFLIMDDGFKYAIDSSGVIPNDMDDMNILGIEIGGNIISCNELDFEGDLVNGAYALRCTKVPLVFRVPDWNSKPVAGIRVPQHVFVLLRAAREAAFDIAPEEYDKALEDRREQLVREEVQKEALRLVNGAGTVSKKAKTKPVLCLVQNDYALKA